VNTPTTPQTPTPPGTRRAGFFHIPTCSPATTPTCSPRTTGNNPYQEAKTITRIAEITLHTQGADAARIHFRQALAIFEQLGVPEAEQARIRLHVLATQP
jgi:hypothetical protein